MTNVNVLNRAAYHGTVVWYVMRFNDQPWLLFVIFKRSFQQGLMAGGLARQLGFCSKTISNATVDTNPPLAKTPEWCKDKTFVSSLVSAQARLWTSIQGAKASKSSLKNRSHDHL